MDNGIHIFIFCCAEYEHLVEYCAKSIDENIQDKILSYNIVSNKNVKIEKYRTILDQDFWRKIDPSFAYRDLYNANHIKQQIFKMNVDRYVDGKVLIVDAEILFLRKMRWVENNGINFYLGSKRHYQPHFDFIKKYFGIDRQIDYTCITDTMIFCTGILKEIRESIEQRNKNTWLNIFNNLIKIDNEFLSEFEIYGNYIFKNYPKTLNKIQQIDYLTQKTNRQEYSYDELMLELRKSYNQQDYVSVNIDSHSYFNAHKTKWLTFYQQIKSDTWPECDNEEDFINLPEEVKKECIEVFGYTPKDNI